MTLEIKAGPVSANLIEQDDWICLSNRPSIPYEVESLVKWAEICAVGGTAIDIGAYTGLFSIIAAKQGCCVIAFEPMPTHVARCWDNFRLNNVEVEIYNACVSDAVGEAVIKFNPNAPYLTYGASLIRSTCGAGNESKLLNVHSMTIDSLGLDQCTAIKIDVERGEPMVLAGARNTLERLKPVLIVEVIGEEEKAAVRTAVPDYDVAAELDMRNWLMVPK
ncbi:FkbM family methyltransferase [Mesorhizobium sp. MSK_1335]|uniref:FkbM family methyltransferase n=1 Tax=Mesorhizobium montanum TaxID=3072323 RepID=A0ABU4ZV19_9HYPH|nr:FkbM family methyltransferase [Mesorhizobium sp. MSK_1335]MDX8529260.1 FkbM family methyltransferase [Mesorhizobium sp. MSK_1335]